MGNSKAYPVFRTDDAATAYAKARHLCALLWECEDRIGLFAELLTVEDVRRMAAVLPGARYEYTGMRTGPAGEDLWFDLDVTTADDRALEPHLPLDMVGMHVPVGIEDRFTAALGRGMAAIDWHGAWPDDPEVGQYASPKYDGVQIVFHGDDPQLDSPAHDHTVFVHVGKFGCPSRARDLAAHIGGDVLGEPLLGW
ncbi:hypothetical protein ACIPW5_05400 [Streptomyces sp. NPDC090077]|uniref:hypothetical protein n=1 Tax=Streptomyces sp. NPDC090077 TaxID=3365938 RepID=UPI00381A1FE9